MRSLFKVIFTALFFSFIFSSCADKLSPEQQEEKNHNEIINSAPIDIDYKINVPSGNISEELKDFSGHWVGKWNDVIPSQLIITDINNEQVTFIYSWGEIPQREIEAGSTKRTVEIDSDAKIKFERNNILYTFVLNSILNKVIGAQIEGDEVLNIVMEKVR